MKTTLTVLTLCLTLFAQELPWVQTEGRSIVNSNGDTLDFRGIHITNESWGEWHWPVSDSLYALGNKDPFFPQKTFPDHALEEQDFQNIKQLNPFLVRYELSYNVFAKDNPLQASNMETFKKQVKRFNEMGIYVVPVLHYGPGLHLSAAFYEDNNPGHERLKSIFEDSTFFEQHCQWWEYVATAFKENSGIAGYQILVEPRVPAKSNGGWSIYKERMSTLCKRIRNIDAKHIIITHHAHSREANPGEEYWSNDLSKSVVDTGEQAIIWPMDPNFFTDSVQSFFLIDVPHMAYSFSLYAPYGFCSEGADKDYNGEEFTDDNFRKNIRAIVAPRAQFGIDNNVPILIDEYGVNHQQKREDVLRWLKVAHEVFDSYNLPSWYFLYKLAIDIHSGNLHNFGLYSYFAEFDGNIELTDSSYEYNNPSLKEKAISSGFDSLFSKYFWNEGNFQSVSITNNQSVYDYMKGYLKHNTSSVVHSTKATQQKGYMLTGSTLRLFKNLAQNHKVTIYSVQGKQIWSATVKKGTQNIELPQKLPGMHILEVSGDELNISHKLVLP